MKTTTFITKPGVGAKPLDWDQIGFLSIDDVLKGEQRGNLKMFGMWQIPISYQALATTQDFTDGNPNRHKLTVFGHRTLTNVKESGYALDGRVSISGKRYRAFTSSTLFELPNGKLINVAILHVCGIGGKV